MVAPTETNQLGAESWQLTVSDESTKRSQRHHRNRGCDQR
jgi:hypothetical protein